MQESMLNWPEEFEHHLEHGECELEAVG